MTEIINVSWCNLCNARPSDGRLTVLLEDEDEPITLDACQICVMDIPKENWM